MKYDYNMWLRRLCHIVSMVVECEGDDKIREAVHRLYLDSR